MYFFSVTSAYTSMVNSSNEKSRIIEIPTVSGFISLKMSIHMFVLYTGCRKILLRIMYCNCAVCHCCHNLS